MNIVPNLLAVEGAEDHDQRFVDILDSGGDDVLRVIRVVTHSAAPFEPRPGDEAR